MSIYINGSRIKIFNFSGGECQVKIRPDQIAKECVVLAKLTSSDAIMSLIMVVDALRQMYPSVQIDLVIPYFPYARQDRVCDFGEAFGIKVMTKIINNLNCRSVTIYDPHSDITPALIDNCKVISMLSILLDGNLLQTIINDKLTIICPDSGAQKKVSAVVSALSALNQDASVLFFKKIRCPKTGVILPMPEQRLGDMHGKSAIILDDICDGGATFIILAEQLIQAGAVDIFLYVTHGIFSSGLSALRKYFKRIYCCNLLIKRVSKNYELVKGAIADGFLVQCSDNLKILWDEE